MKLSPSPTVPVGKGSRNAGTETGQTILHRESLAQHALRLGVIRAATQTIERATQI